MKTPDIDLSTGIVMYGGLLLEAITYLEHTPSLLERLPPWLPVFLFGTGALTRFVLKAIKARQAELAGKDEPATPAEISPSDEITEPLDLPIARAYAGDTNPADHPCPAIRSGGRLFCPGILDGKHCTCASDDDDDDEDLLHHD